MSDAVVIVAAKRTAIGAFNGQFAGLPAHSLGASVIARLVQDAQLAPEDISEVILGQVLTAGQGQNPARQASVKAGLPVETTAWGLNQVCGSGLRAVALGAQQIVTGDAKVVIAGGQESMSLSPHCQHLRNGTKMGNIELIDTMVRDGLWDAFNGYHMGITAENVAEHFEISRSSQDAFALASQIKAAAARDRGRFAREIVPVEVVSRKETIAVDRDEYIRDTTTLDGLAKLKPAFQGGGTVTAGNASGLNDGAAAVLLMSETEASRRGLTPIARIVAAATAGVEPRLMGSGPIPASKAALAKAGWKAGDLDRVEANEAFAAQACAVNQAMGWDPEIVNVNGGAIALGHPIGASGARVLVTLLHELQGLGGGKGLATLCIGGGMGIAMCVEA